MFVCVDDAINRLRIFLDDRPNATIEQKLDEIRGIQIAFALRPADRCIVYLGATFTEGKNLAFSKPQNMLVYSRFLFLFR